MHFSSVVFISFLTLFPIILSSPVSWNSGLDTGSRKQIGVKKRYLGTNAEAPNHRGAVSVPRKDHVSLEDDSSGEKLRVRADSELLDSNAQPDIKSREQQSTKTEALDFPEATFRSLSNGTGHHHNTTSMMSVSSTTSFSPRPTSTGNQLSARPGAQTERLPTRTSNAQAAKKVSHTKPVSTHRWDSTETHNTSSAGQHYSISADVTRHGLRQSLAQESNTLVEPFRTAIPKASAGSKSAVPAMFSTASADYRVLLDGDSNATNIAESFQRPTNTGPTVEATNSIGLSPPYNYNNLKCVDVKNARGPEYWNTTNADNTVSTFISMYGQDKLWCKECFGKASDSDCVQSSPSCREGMRSRSKLPNADGPNWSVGAALFAQLDNADTFSCQMQKNPVIPPDCEDVNGPGAAAMLTSLATAFNSFQLHWKALVQAGSQCQAQMNRFSDVFAPVPDDKGTIIFIIVLTALIGGVAALGTGPIGISIGAAVGTAAGIGSGIGMEEYFASRPGAPDTSSDMGLISKRVSWAFGNVSDELFANGEYTHPSMDSGTDVTLSLQNMMSGGQLIETDGSTDLSPDHQAHSYERFFYQQLAVLTWRNLQVDKAKHIPFIAFDSGPCDSVDPKNAVLGDDIVNKDVNMDYHGNCYYLMDAIVDKPRGVPKCEHVVLPGGTNEDMDKNQRQFAGLSLADFIIPSVLGWEANLHTNGYEDAVTSGNIFTDPQDPGVVNIPVCDYATDKEHPGVDCPVFGVIKKGDECVVGGDEEGNNAEGEYQPGRCGTHVQQWAKNSEKNNANRLNYDQLQIDVADGMNRLIGSATKQSAENPLEVSNSALAFNLIVIPGPNSDDAVHFWYADQYWTSDEEQCSVGEYNDGSHYDGSSRQMDCSFDCPLIEEDKEAPTSATVDHPLPGAAQNAYPGPTTFINTFTHRPSPTEAAAATPTPDYARGVCRMHITQYQKNEEDSNEINDYSVEISVKDAEGKDAASLPKSAAPKDKTLVMHGLDGDFTIQCGENEGEPSEEDTLWHFSYQGKDFDTTSLKCLKGGYEDGNRDMDCNINC